MENDAQTSALLKYLQGSSNLGYPEVREPQTAAVKTGKFVNPLPAFTKSESGTPFKKSENGAMTMDQLLASSKLLMSAKLLKEDISRNNKPSDVHSNLSKVTFEAKRLPSCNSKIRDCSASNSAKAVTPRASERDKNTLFILKALFKQQSQRNEDQAVQA